MENIKNSKTNIDNIFTGLAFSLAFFMLWYRLRDSSLWYDETVEYWISKIMYGSMPLGMRDGTTNMYQRVIGTYQPPLYNFIMYFWLKIHDGELWFRLSGVFFGFLGTIGLFKSIKYITNTITANICVVIASFTYQLIYYYQECAEYSLMIACLCWFLYFFVKAIDNPNKKNIVFATVFAIFPIYSQYGSVFVVIPALILLLIHIILLKNKKNIFIITISYFVAFVFAAIPLIIFYLVPQITNQQSGVEHCLMLERNFFSEVFNGFVAVITCNFMSALFEKLIVVKIFCAILILGILTMFFIRIKITHKFMLILVIISYILYFFAVKTSYYAVAGGTVAGYYNRYSLFFIPIIIITLGVLIYNIFSNEYVLEHIVAPENLMYLRGVFIFLLTIYIYSNWVNKINVPRTKIVNQDARGAVNKWYEIGGFNYVTIVDGNLIEAFSFYERHHKLNDNYTEEKLKIDYTSTRDEREDFLRQNIDIENMSDTVFLIAYDYGDVSRLTSLDSCMMMYGYKRNVIFDNDVKLIEYDK